MEPSSILLIHITRGHPQLVSAAFSVTLKLSPSRPAAYAGCVLMRNQGRANATVTTMKRPRLGGCNIQFVV